ncbi:hypothetical protein MRX96_003963 [Rhipicephalus microplus]
MFWSSHEVQLRLVVRCFRIRVRKEARIQEVSYASCAFLRAYCLSGATWKPEKNTVRSVGKLTRGREWNAASDFRPPEPAGLVQPSATMITASASECRYDA